MQPNLTYYYGQVVESVEEIEGGGGWRIVFETGVSIVVPVENYAKPENSLVGKQFSASIMDQHSTRLYFGTEENPRAIVMHVNPLKYAISDPNFEDGRLVYPQSTAEERSAAFEPSAPGDRVVDGPSEDWQRRQAAADPEYVAEEPSEATEAAQGGDE